MLTNVTKFFLTTKLFRDIHVVHRYCPPAVVSPQKLVTTANGRTRPSFRTRYEKRALTKRADLQLMPVVASSGVVKVILSFYRDDDKGSALERHRGRIPFDMA